MPKTRSIILVREVRMLRCSTGFTIGFSMNLDYTVTPRIYLVFLDLFSLELLIIFLYSHLIKNSINNVKNNIMNAVSTVYGCSSMTARSKWLSWAPPNFITNLETEYAPDETYSLTRSNFTICLAFRVGFPGRSCYGTARN